MLEKKTVSNRNLPFEIAGYVCFVIALFAVVVFYRSSSENSASISISTTKLDETNDTPAEFFDFDGNINLIPENRLHDTFLFAFISDHGELFSTKRYKRSHPDDIVIKSYLGAGQENLVILSKSKPDPKFFKEAR